MTPDYWIGLFSLPAFAAAACIVWALLSSATWAWNKLHVRLLAKVSLPANPVRVRLRGTPAPEPRPKYEDAANKIRDALLRSPRLYSALGLGWYVVLVRDIKETEEME